MINKYLVHLKQPFSLGAKTLNSLNVKHTTLKKTNKKKTPKPLTEVVTYQHCASAQDFPAHLHRTSAASKASFTEETTIQDQGNDFQPHMQLFRGQKKHTAKRPLPSRGSPRSQPPSFSHGSLLGSCSFHGCSDSLPCSSFFKRFWVYSQTPPTWGWGRELQ